MGSTSMTEYAPEGTVPSLRTVIVNEPLPVLRLGADTVFARARSYLPNGVARRVVVGHRRRQRRCSRRERRRWCRRRRASACRRRWRCSSSSRAPAVPVAVQRIVAPRFSAIGADAEDGLP